MDTNRDIELDYLYKYLDRLTELSKFGSYFHEIKAVLSKIDELLNLDLQEK